VIFKFIFMKTAMNHIRDLSYPCSKSAKEVWVSSLVLSAAVYLFLVVFQPFGTYNYHHSWKYVLLMPYAAITLCVFGIGTSLTMNASERTFLKEIFRMGGLLAICAFFSYCYSILFINNARFAFRGMIIMYGYTFALGIPVCALYVLWRYVYLKYRPLLVPAPVATFQPASLAPSQLTIIPDTGKPLTIPADHFLFAQAEGNYCYIFYEDDHGLQKQLLRVSLKRIEAQAGSQEIVRCHRCYVVNLNKVSSMKGNAQGYKLNMPHFDDAIPVSRQYIDVVRGGSRTV